MRKEGTKNKKVKTRDSSSELQIENTKDTEDKERLCKENSLLRGLVIKGLRDRLELEDIPEEVRAALFDDSGFTEKDIVLERVKTGSSSWSGLPDKWKYDAHVVCAVFERDRNQFRRAESNQEIEWKNLPFRLQMNQDIILNGLRAVGGPDLKDIPPRFQRFLPFLSVAILHQKIPLDEVPASILREHPDLAVFAVQNDALEAEDCPCLTREYLKDCIEQGKLNWTRLPLTLQQDVNFALSISRFADEETPEDILRECPSIRRHEAFWRLLAAKAKRMSSSVLDEYLPHELRADFDLMVQVCIWSPSAYVLVEEHLAGNRDFLIKVVMRNGFVMEYLTHETQQLHRDVIIQALPEFGKQLKKYTMSPGLAGLFLADALQPAFWSDQEFCLAWVQTSLGFPNCLSRHDLATWCGNREICLTHVLQTGDFHYKMDETFTKDASFMLEVVQRYPSLYLKASGAAKINPKVMAAAFAGSPTLAIRTLTELHLNGQNDRIECLVKYLRGELLPYDTFVSCVLGNMLSTQSMVATGTPLTMLNQGLETSLRYKKLLAAYLGIPSGERLTRLLKARESVQEAMAPWTLDPDRIFSLKKQEPWERTSLFR